MFAELTSTENTALYLMLDRAYLRLDKVSGMLIDLEAYGAAQYVNGMSSETIGLLHDLNAAAKLAEHTAAACDTITKASA